MTERRYIKYLGAFFLPLYTYGTDLFFYIMSTCKIIISNKKKMSIHVLTTGT